MAGHIQGCFEYEVVLVNRRGLRDSQALVGNGCLAGIRQPGASHSVFSRQSVGKTPGSVIADSFLD